MADTAPTNTWLKTVPTEEGFYFIRYEIDKDEYTRAEPMEVRRDNHGDLVAVYLGEDAWDALEEEAFSDAQFYGPLEIPFEDV